MEYLDVNDLLAVISYDVNPFQMAFFNREVLPALVAAKAAGAAAAPSLWHVLNGNMSFETMGFYVFFQPLTDLDGENFYVCFPTVGWLLKGLFP